MKERQMQMHEASSHAPATVRIQEGLCWAELAAHPGKDLFPYLKVPLDLRCLGMKLNHWIQCKVKTEVI